MDEGADEQGLLADLVEGQAKLVGGLAKRFPLEIKGQTHRSGQRIPSMVLADDLECAGPIEAENQDTDTALDGAGRDPGDGGDLAGPNSPAHDLFEEGAIGNIEKTSPMKDVFRELPHLQGFVAIQNHKKVLPENGLFNAD